MFKTGLEYERTLLLDFVGSKQQVSGMIWGNKEPDCVILTSGGKHGESAGYNDNENEDGSWFYIGQGGKGNQDPFSIANSNLTDGKKTVLLFSTREPNTKEVKARGNRKKFYKFEGIFEVGSWIYYTPTKGLRMGDKLVRYHLIPAENIFNSDNNPIPNTLIKEPIGLYELRQKMQNQNNKPPKVQRTNIVEYRARSLEVKEYAITRANGICEYCVKEAPFISLSGVPFLEVHHIHKLADDGPDTPENVSAICPNCHREAHYGMNKEELKEGLIIIIKKKEEKIDQLRQ
jgi:5-methylcytosine-specific restriction protein A